MTISSFNTGAYLAITDDQYPPANVKNRATPEVRPSLRQTPASSSVDSSLRQHGSCSDLDAEDCPAPTDTKTKVAAICKAHYEALIVYIKNRTNQDEDLAREVAQETFATLTRHLGAGRSITHARGFVFQIAKTKLIDHHRYSKARMHGAHSDIEDHQLVSATPDAERTLDASRRLEALEAAVLELPERCREVLVLKIYEDLSYQEIASRRGISVSMVEKHVSKAFKIIRDKMGH